MPLMTPACCALKNACVRVCPYDVFELRKLSAEQKRALPFFIRLKVAVHGNEQAFAVREQDCHGCGACVAICPEKAITLVAV